MADRIIRWYIDGLIARAKVQVGGTHRTDADYVPQKVSLTCRETGAITTGTEVDILDDGVSIFDDKPALNTYDTEKVWTTIPENVIREDSIVRLDITGICDETPVRDLTVELFLTKV